MRLLLSILSITAFLACANSQVPLPNGCFEAFYKSALTTANSLRALHKSPPLITDAKLNSSSLFYANLLVDITYGPSGIPDIGENVLFKSTISEVTKKYCARNIHFNLYY